MTGAREPAALFVVSEGIRLHCADWGAIPGAGSTDGAPPILLLHGNRDHARSWDRTARALGGGHRVVAMDMRGHGDSAWSPDGAYLIPYRLLDLVAVVDALGPGAVSIVGHSLGGILAARFAALFPDRVERLVLIDAMGPSPAILDEWAATGPVERLRAWTAKRRRLNPARRRPIADMEEATDRLAANTPHLARAWVRALAEHAVRAGPHGLQWKFDPRVAMLTPEDFAVPGAAFWREIAAPTLIVQGTESWIPDPETDGRAEHIRDRRTIVYDRAGHWVHHDRFDDVIGPLRTFLDA